MILMKLRSLFLATVLATASLGAAAAQAQYYPHPAPPPGYGHPDHYHQWHHGDRYYGPREVVHHWGNYHLPPPPYGFVWVRSGGQFLMLGRDGMIARVWGP
jgi:Nickel/cobalt transporter regulator